MANIKFSQFTVGNTESDIDFVVGYKGANNIQISPANLLSATLTGYLPLTGGTMTGDIILNDDVRLRAGTSGDFSFFHDGSNSKINNNTGNIVIENFKDDGDISFKTDDGTGSTTEYFRVDGGAERVLFSKEIRTIDNVKIQAGTGGDLDIFHTGSNATIDNATGALIIQNSADDSDIVFQCDDGSGGITDYFRLDGSTVTTVVSKEFKFEDNVKANFGTGVDLQIYHDSFSSQIDNYVGNLLIKQRADDADISFQCDDGSGSITEYFRVDGGTERIESSKSFRFVDSARVQLGASSDLQIYHDGSNSYISNSTNALYIQQLADDSDIVFQSDDGSGGVTEYFRLDGSTTSMQASKNIVFADDIRSTFGGGADMAIYHNSASQNGIIENFTNDLIIQNNANDEDVVFKCDDGSGGITTYMFLDGSTTLVQFYKSTKHSDNIKANFGNSADMSIYHDSNDARIENSTGNIVIQNNANDKDIIFKSDDGSGGVTEYFRLDGSSTYNIFSKDLYLIDDVILRIGTGNDLRIFHETGSTSKIENYTGNLVIQQRADDSDIVFQCDDGSGGLTEYFRLDGSFASAGTVYTVFPDNSRAAFGNNFELNIYHDGSDTFIVNSNGELLIRDNDTIRLQKNNGENMLRAIADGEVELYHNNVKKLDTRTTGIRILGVSEYADNTAAIAGGLTTGDVYRTGDLLKIVH